MDHSDYCLMCIWEILSPSLYQSIITRLFNEGWKIDGILAFRNQMEVTLLGIVTCVSSESHRRYCYEHSMTQF